RMRTAGCGQPEAPSTCNVGAPRVTRVIPLCAAGTAKELLGFLGGWAGRPGRSGRGVGAAHSAPALGRALVLVEAAPGAVLLGTRDRVVETFGAHRALGADLLGLALADLPLRLALAVRAEVEHEVLAPAAGGILPPPARAGAQRGLPTYLRHG